MSVVQGVQSGAPILAEELGAIKNRKRAKSKGQGAFTI